jgi:hypothetical protein
LQIPDEPGSLLANPVQLLLWLEIASCVPNWSFWRTNGLYAKFWHSHWTPVRFERTMSRLMYHPVPDIEILSLRVTLRARNGGVLPGFLHSTIRGAFGHALKRQACSPDELGSSPYERLFEGVPYPERQPLPGRTSPPPYLIRCDTHGQPASPEVRQITTGDVLRFTFTLMGFACDELRAVALALEDAAEAGLGAGRIPFELVAIECLTCAGPVPLDLGAPQRPTGPNLRMLEAAFVPERETEALFHTPLQLRQKGNHVRVPDGEQLLRAAHSRLRRIDAALAPVPFMKPHPPEHILQLRWHQSQQASIERFSARQAQKVPLIGLVGSAAMSTDSPIVFRKVLAAAIVGIGHGTTQGCGQFTVANALPLLACFGAANP